MESSLPPHRADGLRDIPTALSGRRISFRERKCSHHQPRSRTKCGQRFYQGSGEELTVFPDLSEGHWAYYTVLEAANGHDYEQDGEGENWTRLKYQTETR